MGSLPVPWVQEGGRKAAQNHATNPTTDSNTPCMPTANRVAGGRAPEHTPAPPPKKNQKRRVKCEHQGTHGKQPGRPPRPRPQPPRGTPRAASEAESRDGGDKAGRRGDTGTETMPAVVHIAVFTCMSCVPRVHAQPRPQPKPKPVVHRAGAREGRENRRGPSLAQCGSPQTATPGQNKAPACPRARAGGEAEGPQVAHQTPKQRRASLRGDRGATATRRRNAGQQPPPLKRGGASRREQGGRGRRDGSRRSGGGGRGRRGPRETGRAPSFRSLPIPPR